MGRLLCVSIYWDGTFNSLPPEFEKAKFFARDNNYTLMMGGDVNARSELWSDAQADSRGKAIEDLLVKYDLDTVNKGNSPTCTVGNKGLIIDITITNGEICHINNWRVS